MCNYDQGFCAAHCAFQALAEILRIQRGQAFVEQNHLGILQECAGEKNAAALALLQLPAGFAYDLVEPGGHAFQQRPKTDLLAELRSFL